MALVVGENSWVTVAEADDYLSLRMGAAEWFALPTSAAPGEASKELYLVSAYQYLIAYPGTSLLPEDDDQAIKDAQCEMALFLQQYGDEYARRQALMDSGVQEFTASRDWKEKLSESDLPQNVKNLLLSIGRLSGSGGGFVTFTGED